MSGPDASRPYIEAAAPDHPSLLDPGHLVDSLFGVVNIPNVTWIDEQGTIVRPPEPGWPDAESRMPTDALRTLPKLGRAPSAPPRPERVEGAERRNPIASGQDRETYADAVRDWVAHGGASVHVLSPSEVVARSQPRPLTESAAAAHFELAGHLWHAGHRDRAIVHFNACHRLQPDNWTYKRQAWSMVSNERIGGDFGRFAQGPLRGEEADWPFDSDFRSDVAVLDSDYYPRTIDDPPAR
jgi:hypothetical protein